MKPAVLSALEVIFVIIAVLILSVISVMGIMYATAVIILFILMPYIFTGDTGKWIAAALFSVSLVLCAMVCRKIGVRWYRWLCARRLRRLALVPADETSEAHTSLPELRVPDTEGPGEQSLPHDRVRGEERLLPPSVPVPGVAQRRPFNRDSAEPGAESPTPEPEVLPSLGPASLPLRRHSDDCGPASVLVLPCNHFAPCHSLPDMRDLRTCPVCRGDVREVIRQARV